MSAFEICRAGERPERSLPAGVGYAARAGGPPRGRAPDPERHCSRIGLFDADCLQAADDEFVGRLVVLFDVVEVRLEVEAFGAERVAGVAVGLDVRRERRQELRFQAREYAFGVFVGADVEDWPGMRRGSPYWITPTTFSVANAAAGGVAGPSPSPRTDWRCRRRRRARRRRSARPANSRAARSSGPGSS